MDDYEMDDTELFGLGGLSPDQEAEDAGTAADMSVSPLGALDIQAKYGQAIKQYETSTQKVLDQIAAARQRLLSRPTEKSKGEYLRGLATALTTPPERTDPRFYERKNLFTFLRDVGEYGAGEEKAAKEAKLKQEEDIARLDELRAKYEQQAAAQQLRDLGPLYREIIKPKREAELPADARSLRYYRGILKDPSASEEDKKDAQAMITKLTRVPSESTPKQSWNERVVQAKLRKKQGKATAEDEIIIEMSEKAGSDFLSILNMLSGKKEE